MQPWSLLRNMVGGYLVLGGNTGVTLYHSDGSIVYTPSSIVNPRQQIGLHDAAASAISFALGNGHNLVESSYWPVQHAIAYLNQNMVIRY